MSKYGWTSGKGLGAAESGMTTALSVSRPSSTTPKLSRAQKKKQKHFGLEVAEAPQGGAAVGMAARNNVVDSSRQGRAQEREKEMGGEPSRVVLLENICGADEVDDELPGEIAEEANKLGVVERCAVVVVPVEEDEAAGGDREEVRVFLVMSGFVLSSSDHLNQSLRTDSLVNLVIGSRERTTLCEVSKGDSLAVGPCERGERSRR